MKLAFKIYSFLIIFCIYLPELGAIDMNVTQWMYLTVINSSFLLYLLIKNKLNLSLVIGNTSFILYLLFFLGAILSIIKSINYTESFLRLNEIFCILSSLFILINFHVQKNTNYKFILTIFSFALGLEVFGTLNQYRLINSYTTFDFSMANEIRGFTGNKNVAAASVAFKIPFLVLLFNELGSKKYINKILILIIGTASFYVIMLYSARAVFLSIFLSIAVTLGLIFFKKFFKQKKLIFDSDVKQTLLYLIPFLFAFLIFSSRYNDTNRIAVDNRVNSIVNNSDDQSIQQRLRFYGHAISSIAENPILGVGIGNWKLYSIKYEAKNMYSYVVPFFAHNDFLEILAEIGIIGSVFFILFFIKMIQYNFIILSNWLNSNLAKSPNFIVFVPLLIYLIDSNLNFPLGRPIMQVQLLLYLVILLYLLNTKNVNEVK
jgi:O-antigen ligase